MELVTRGAWRLKELQSFEEDCYQKYNTIQYFIDNSPWGFSVTMLLREVTIVSKKTKINSKTRYYVCMKIK